MIKVKNKILPQIALFLLILLWVYAAASKLIDYPRFERQMQRQALLPFMKSLLIYLLPWSELMLAGMLCFEKTQKIGLISSLILLFTFTSYIVLALTNSLGKYPCSCGGILEHMGWTAHLFFNLFFLGLTFIIIYSYKGKEPAKNHIQ
jgi:hypothetical protein